MYNRQVTFASGGMLSAFKPVGDHDVSTSSHSNPQSSDSNPQSTSSHSTPTLYYPMVTSAASQPWEPTVLIKPHPPVNTAMPAATPTKRKDTSDKAKVKKKKKQEVDHSGFVPRKIASTSSTVRNPLLVTPLPSEKKEESEQVKETDDLFSLYDDCDIAPALAPPTDHTSSITSIWDSFEATTVQQSSTIDSEGSCDVSSSEEEDKCLETTPTIDHVSQPVTQVVTSVDHISTSLDEKNGNSSLKQSDNTHPQVEDVKESKHERLLRLLGMPMKNFLSAGNQCPLKDHTTMKVTNSGSYLEKPHPSKCYITDTVVDQGTAEVTQVKNEKLPVVNKQQNNVKKPDGLSFGLSKKREKLRQSTTGQLFDKEDSPVRSPV